MCMWLQQQRKTSPYLCKNEDALRSINNNFLHFAVVNELFVKKKNSVCRTACGDRKFWHSEGIAALLKDMSGELDVHNLWFCPPGRVSSGVCAFATLCNLRWRNTAVHGRWLTWLLCSCDVRILHTVTRAVWRWMKSLSSIYLYCKM